LPCDPGSPGSPLPAEVLSFKNNSIKVTKRACMARRRTSVEAWMGIPDEVDF
jgi:hypothetical protein